MSLGMSKDVIVKSVQTVMVVNYCDIAIMALLLFDMAITFADEYTYMWKGRKTGVTVLFLANRYCMLAQYILAPVTDCIRFYDTTRYSFFLVCFRWTESVMPPLSCTRLELTRAAFSAICGIIICIFSSFRVYAINRQHWKWAIAVAVLQLANWGINNYVLSAATFFTLPPPLFGCTPINNVSPSVYNQLVIPGRSFMIASDAIVLFVTWANTYGIRKTALSAQFRTPLLTMLLRDGTMYFLLTMILNIIILCLWFDKSLKFFPNLVQPLQSVLITHFLLKLRDVSSTQTPLAHNTNTQSGIATRTQASTLLFNDIDIMGNMGAQLRHSFLASSDGFASGTEEEESGWGTDEDEEEDAHGSATGHEQIELRTLKNRSPEPLSPLSPSSECTGDHRMQDALRVEVG